MNIQHWWPTQLRAEVGATVTHIPVNRWAASSPPLSRNPVKFGDAHSRRELPPPAGRAPIAQGNVRDGEIRWQAGNLDLDMPAARFTPDLGQPIAFGQLAADRCRLNFLPIFAVSTAPVPHLSHTTGGPLERANLLLKLLGDEAVPCQHIQCADLAGLIIRSDMDDRQPLCRSSQALAVSQGMVLRLRSYPLPRNEPLPVGLEGLDEERIDGGHGLTPPALVFSLRSHSRGRNG